MGRKNCPYSKCCDSSAVEKSGDLNFVCTFLWEKRKMENDRLLDQKLWYSGGSSNILRIMLTFTTILALISGTMSASDSFTVQPRETPYYANGGDTGLILDCAVQPRYAQEPYTLHWLKIVQGHPRIITIGNRNNDPGSYVLEQGASGSYNLKILEVRYEHDNGQFFCQIQGPQGPPEDSRPAKVVVLEPPGPPNIFEQPQGPISEGDIVQAKCQSTGGNPPPDISWRFSNETVIPEEWSSKTNANSRGDPTTSVLRFSASPEHNDLSLQCLVTNKAMEQEQPLYVSSRRLQVRFKPMVSVGPTKIYNVEKGQQARLLCNARGNPPPQTYQWVQSGGSASYKFDQMNASFNVGTDHQGVYTCYASNDVGQGSDKLELNVVYGPQINLEKEILVAEGGLLEVDCRVDANPAVSHIQWDGPAGNFGTQTLRVPNIRRDAAGDYTCSAKNEILVYGASEPIPRSASRTMRVKVAYPPGPASISISEEPVAVGETVSLTCMTADPGEPIAQYRWNTPGMGEEYIFNSQTTHTITNVQLTHAGRYACMAFNSAGQGTAGYFNLKVYEPARLFQFLETEREWTAGDPSKSLSCGARGNPVPSITWMQDGKPLDDGLLDTHWSVHANPDMTSCADSNRCSFEVSSTLTWRDRVRWTDKGVFTCRAFNGAGEPHDSNMTLKVRHGAEILGDRNQAFAAADVGGTAEIVCRSSARPEPQFRWFFAGQEIKEGGRYLTTEDTYQAVDEFANRLIIQSTNENDFGEYMCKVANNLGDDQLVFKLQRKAAPLPPSNLRHMSLGSTWVELGWDPGFNGGIPQTFGVEQILLDPLTQSAVGLPTYRNMSEPALQRYSPAAYNNFARRFKRYSPGVQPVTLNATDLDPLSSYRFSLRAWNGLGDTDWSEPVTITTHDSPVDDTIAKPEDVLYNPDQRTIKFKAGGMDESKYCMQVYAQRPQQADWRKLGGCASASGKITGVPRVPNVKTRFCSKDTGYCSQSTPALMTSEVAGPVPWMIVGPVLGVVAFLLVLFLIVALACCLRKRKAPEKNQMVQNRNNKAKTNKDYEMETNQARPQVSAPYLTNGNSKADQENGTTVIAGSQADSGVFTLGSQYGQPSFDPNGAYDPMGNQMAYTNAAMTRGSYDENNDRWGNAADPYGDMIDPYANGQPYAPGMDGGFGDQAYHTDGGMDPNFAYYDPYANPNGMVDMNPHGTQGRGVQGSQDESLNSGYSTPNQRRVIREIIV